MSRGNMEMVKNEQEQQKGGERKTGDNMESGQKKSHGNMEVRGWGRKKKNEK